MTNKRENLVPDYRLILLTVAFLVFVYLISPILSPFLTAAVLSYICCPLVDKLSKVSVGRLSIGRGAASILVMTFLLGFILLLLLIVAPLLQNELMLLAERLPKFVILSKSILEPWLVNHLGISLEIDAPKIQQLLTDNWKSASNFVGEFLVSLSSHGLAVVAWLANLLLIPVVLFYLLRDWHYLENEIRALVPRSYLKNTTKIASEINQVLSEFLRGQLSVMVLMSIYYCLALWLAGLDLALPIGMITGLLGFVPYLGIGTGICLSLLAGVLQFSSLHQMLPLMIAFGIGQILEGFILTPWLVGDRIGLHPVIVLFALLACSQLLGFVGLLLALPISAATAIGLKHAKLHYFSTNLYLK